MAISAGVLGLLAGGMGAGAAPDAMAPDPSVGDGVREAPPIRDRLEAAVARLDAARANFTAALDSLDAGADPMDVVQTLMASREERDGARPLIDLGFLRPGGSDPGFRGGRRFGREPDLLVPHDRAGGDRRADQRGGRGNGPGPDRTSPSVEETTAFLEEHMPSLASRLRRADEAQRGDLERMIERLSPRIGRLMWLLEHDPELGVLRVDEMRSGLDVLALDRARRRGTSPPREEAARALAAHFDARTAIATLELERAEATLDERRENLMLQRSRRDEIIAAKMAEFDRRAAPAKLDR